MSVIKTKKHQCGCWGNGGKETSPLSPKRGGNEKARKTLDKSEGFKTESPTWLLFRSKEGLLPSTRFWLWGPGTSWEINAQGYAVLNSSCKPPPVNSYFTKHRTCPRAVAGKRWIEAGVGVGGWRWWSDSYSRKGEKGWGVVGDGVWRDWQRRTTGGTRIEREEFSTLNTPQPATSKNKKPKTKNPAWA